jgi:hypothetical protein
MIRSVVIDCFPASVARYVDDHAIVAVDVIRATTVAVTAVAVAWSQPMCRTHSPFGIASSGMRSSPASWRATCPQDST